MGVTTEKSTQETNRTATPPVKNPSYNEHGRVRTAYFAFNQGAAAGDATSTQDLVTLPPGIVRLIKTDSKFVCSAFGSSRTLDIGYAAHTNADGTAVPLSANAILDDADVSAAAKLECGAGTGALGTDPTILFDSREGVKLYATVAGGTIPAGATIKGYFKYVTD